MLGVDTMKDPEKLVRDKFDTILPSREFRIATKEELPHFLALKIVEEAEELAEEIEAGDIEKIADELGDVLDVVWAISSLYKIPKSELIKRQSSKMKERGLFNRGLLLKRFEGWEVL